MVSRLSASDAAFYRLEGSATPVYVGSLLILRRPRGGFSYEKLLAAVEQRLPEVPRYRQKVRAVTMGLARPVWIDDRDFDITYHVRHSALPSPGGDRQLHELVARLAERPLDKTRPLWEMRLVEGLADNRAALYVKSHQALVGGISAPTIDHVLVDRARRPPPFGEDIWIPRREPGATELLAGALADWVSTPGIQLMGVGSTINPLASGSGLLTQAGRKVLDVASALARGTAPDSPLNGRVSRNRLFTVARGRLEDYQRVRARYDCAIDDVVLAVITGALRNWLLSRGEPVAPTGAVRAMAPVPVCADGGTDPAGDGQAIRAVTPFLVDLPVGETNPVIRLSQIAFAAESRPAAAGDARAVPATSGFAPPTLHAMGVRVATGFAGPSRRVFNVLVTNASGGQRQMYVCGAKLLEAYNVSPLLHNQALAVGVTSYNGILHYGISADRKAMSDVDVLPVLLEEALGELLEAAR